MSTTTNLRSRIGRRARVVIMALGLALVLVTGLNWGSYAATGAKLILGKSNTASTTTVVTRTTTGPVLTLKTRATGNAPIATNGTGKVANLNADRLDNLDSSAFARAGQLQTVKTTANAALSRSAIATAFVDTYPNSQEYQAESGFDTISYDATYNRYRLRMTGISYHFLQHVAVVTPSCAVGQQAMVSVSNADGMIDVWMRDIQGAPIKCDFSVVVFKMHP